MQAGLDNGMDDWSLELRIVWEDLPEMIELETRVHYGEWSACSRAYTKPKFITRDTERLVAWARDPKGVFRLEAGEDTGMGWLVLAFYTIDLAGHARCSVTLATGGNSRDAHTAETWRFAIEMKTELGLIERFGHECLSLGCHRTGVATLCGLAT